jgi:hypothetical protein
MLNAITLQLQELNQNILTLLGETRVTNTLLQILVDGQLKEELAWFDEEGRMTSAMKRQLPRLLLAELDRLQAANRVRGERP